MQAIRYLLLSALIGLSSPIAFGQSFEKDQSRAESGKAPEQDERPVKMGNDAARANSGNAPGYSGNAPKSDTPSQTKGEKAYGENDQGNDPELSSKDRARADNERGPTSDRKAKGGRGEPNPNRFQYPPQELWALHPGSGYVNGKNYVDAGNYCNVYGGQLASQAQMMTAHERGFSFCAYGWLQGGQAGFVMQGTHKGCGRDGWNSAGKPDQNRKFGAYCVGQSAPSSVPSRLRADISPQ